MRQFYQVFSEFDQFSTQCIENLRWTNIRLIMHIDEPSEQDYYIKDATGVNSKFTFINF